MSDKKDSVKAAKSTNNTNTDKANDWTVPFDLQTMYNRYNMELTGGISQSTINSYKKQYNLNDEQAKALAILYRAQQNNPNAGNGGGGGSNPDDDIEKAVKAIKNQKLEDAAKALGIKAGDLKGTIAAASDALSQYAYVDDTYIRPEYTDVTNAQIRNLADLQSQLGTNVNYDFNSIKGIYDDATRAAYDIEQNSGAERSYYRHLADAQNTALESIRNAYGQAVTQGASKGMQAANQLSAILGFGATANEEATQLAIDKQARANEYAAQMAQNAKDALSYSNSTQMDLASLSRQLYNDDIQQKTAELAYNQGINTDYANYNSARYTANASLNASLANTAAGIYNNNQSALAQLQSAIAAANATRDASKVNFQGTKFNALKNLEGTKYSADQNLRGVMYQADKYSK